MENFRLKVLRTVARHQNFRIAEELLITQPAVTQQIKAQEAELDTALFIRSAGRIALTPSGAALLPFAERLAALAVEAREAVAAESSSSAGALAIAASQTIGQYLLPRLIAAFLVENPKVAIFVTRELGSGSRRIVEQGLERVGIRTRELQVRMTFDTTEGLLSAVEAGLGIAFVSRWAVRSQLALGTLQIVRNKGLHLRRTFLCYVIQAYSHRRRRRLPPFRPDPDREPRPPRHGPR